MPYYDQFLIINEQIFTVGEAVRSTFGNSHEKEKEENEDRFHVSLIQTIL